MYTARLQSAPPRPPMNENRDRGHRPDPSAAVALSSQNVSTDASDRVASRATPSGASTTRDAPSPPPCKRQKMVSVPPGTRASAPGRRIQSIFVGPSPSSGEFSKETDSAETESAGPSSDPSPTNPAATSAGSNPAGTSILFFFPSPGTLSWSPVPSSRFPIPSPSPSSSSDVSPRVDQ